MLAGAPRAAARFTLGVACLLVLGCARANDILPTVSQRPEPTPTPTLGRAVTPFPVPTSPPGPAAAPARAPESPQRVRSSFCQTYPVEGYRIRVLGSQDNPAQEEPPRERRVTVLAYILAPSSGSTLSPANFGIVDETGMVHEATGAAHGYFAYPLSERDASQFVYFALTPDRRPVHFVFRPPVMASAASITWRFDLDEASVMLPLPEHPPIPYSRSGEDPLLVAGQATVGRSGIEPYRVQGKGQAKLMGDGTLLFNDVKMGHKLATEEIAELVTALVLEARFFDLPLTGQALPFFAYSTGSGYGSAAPGSKSVTEVWLGASTHCGTVTLGDLEDRLGESPRYRLLYDLVTALWEKAQPSTSSPTSAVATPTCTDRITFGISDIQPQTVPQGGEFTLVVANSAARCLPHGGAVVDDSVVTVSVRLGDRELGTFQCPGPYCWLKLKVPSDLPAGPYGLAIQSGRGSASRTLVVAAQR